ncbi:MAG: hypothetical protein SOZ02_07080, partial [Hallerella porci]|uniref:hypothetical protein n=1 Tax=Hallerella porci TaxID=1945871 RepID=UPI002A8355F9
RMPDELGDARQRLHDRMRLDTAVLPADFRVSSGSLQDVREQRYGRGVAVAGYKNDVFYIDPSSFNSTMQNPKQFFKENVSDIQRRKKLRHLAIDFASNVKRHLIDHEMGHYIFEKCKNSGKYSELTKIIEKTKKNGDMAKISEYAERNRDEFFAEIYAMFARGDTTLPNYLVDYVRKVKNDTVLQK